jgi:hypothetical protein
MHPDPKKYNKAQAPADRAICQRLADEIERALPEAENKVWHAHPVWFLDGNPIVGYSELKDSVRLLFWSGLQESRASSRDRHRRGRGSGPGVSGRQRLGRRVADLHRFLCHRAGRGADARSRLAIGGVQEMPDGSWKGFRAMGGNEPPAPRKSG